MARALRKSPQHKVTIPVGEMSAVKEAMEWDGISNFSQFALAAVRQRTRRLLREKAAEAASAAKATR